MKLRALLLRFRDALWLLPWVVIVVLGLRLDPFGLDEEGAKALLFAWSIGDQVASSVFTLGAPDIRALLWLPLGALWSGQLDAAKVFGVLVLAAAAVALFRWRAREEQHEAALLATGLLLISPLTLAGLDALSAGPYLLAVAAAAYWLDHWPVNDRGAFGGGFFAQMLFCAASTSLHPAGLAYPVVLFWTWYRRPPNPQHRQLYLVSIVLVVVLVLVMRWGWPGMSWGENPLPSAATVFSGIRAERALGVGYWLGGLALLGLAIVIGLHERLRLLADTTGGTLLLGALFGLVAADRTWALLLLALVLYGGMPWLLRACAPLSGRGFVVERGWLWILLLLLCTFWMRTDRADYEAGHRHLLSAQDELISAFAQGVNELRAGDQPAAAPAARILVASSWPARTTVACRCDALPLPPVAKDPVTQLAMMRGISHLLLGDTQDVPGLASNLAQMGPRVETLSRLPGGVILRIKPP